MASPRQDTSYPSPGMRVSDAERNEAADRLSKHYGDGRLDEAEFNRRLDQAMNAKTHADLRGLFDDLPPAEGPAPRPAPRERHRPPYLRLLLLVLLVLAVTGAAHAVAHVFLPWLLVAVLVFLLLRLRPWHRRRW